MFASLVAVAATPLTVTQAKLGTAVQNRQLSGEATSFPVDSQVYLWLEVAGGSSDSITVTWKSPGGGSLQTQLDVKGSPWRTWAYKTVRAAGDWQVSVSSADGTVLKTLSFSVK